MSHVTDLMNGFIVTWDFFGTMQHSTEIEGIIQWLFAVPSPQRIFNTKMATSEKASFRAINVRFPL